MSNWFISHGMIPPSQWDWETIVGVLGVFILLWVVGSWTQGKKDTDPTLIKEAKSLSAKFLIALWVIIWLLTGWYLATGVTVLLLAVKMEMNREEKRRKSREK